MIAEIHSALWDFWAQFAINGTPIPVFHSGGVPDAQEFPYITFETPRADTMATMPLTAFGWFRNGDKAVSYAQRLAFWEAVEKALPTEGLRLPLSVGCLMLHRGSGDFLYPGTDEEDEKLIFGRVGYEVTFYTK